MNAAVQDVISNTNTLVTDNFSEVLDDIKTVISEVTEGNFDEISQFIEAAEGDEGANIKDSIIKVEEEIKHEI